MHIALPPAVPSLLPAGEPEQEERQDAGLTWALRGKAVQGAPEDAPAEDSSQQRRHHLQEVSSKHSA